MFQISSDEFIDRSYGIAIRTINNIALVAIINYGPDGHGGVEDTTTYMVSDDTQGFSKVYRFEDIEEAILFFNDCLETTFMKVS